MPKDMRTWIAELEAAGELIRIDKPVDPLTQMGALLYQSREKALLFHDVGALEGQEAHVAVEELAVLGRAYEVDQTLAQTHDCVERSRARRVVACGDHDSAARPRNLGSESGVGEAPRHC